MSAFDFRTYETKEGNFFVTSLKNSSRPLKSTTFLEAVEAAKLVHKKAEGKILNLLLTANFESLCTLQAFRGLSVPFKVSVLCFKNYPEDPAVLWVRNICSHFDIPYEQVEFDFEDPVHIQELASLAQQMPNNEIKLVLNVWASGKLNGYSVLPGRICFPIAEFSKRLMKFNFPEQIENTAIEFVRRSSEGNFLTSTAELVTSFLMTKVAACSYYRHQRNMEPIPLTSTIKMKIHADGGFPETGFEDFLIKDLPDPILIASYRAQKEEVNALKAEFDSKYLDSRFSNTGDKINFDYSEIAVSDEDLQSEFEKKNHALGAGIVLPSLPSHDEVINLMLERPKNLEPLNSIAAFPTLISTFKFSGDRHVVKKVISEIDYHRNNKNTISQKNLLERIELEELIIFFKDAVKIYLKQMGYLLENFQITQCWANKATFGESHHFHSHPNSFLSGVFYLQQGGGDIYFGLNQHQAFKPLIFTQNPFNSEAVAITPEDGLLVLFPSKTYHSTAGNASLTNRYSISFNVLPKGSIGDWNAAYWAHM
jgi:uncharacterized protein (TIGR02466 family)